MKLRKLISYLLLSVIALYQIPYYPSEVQAAPGLGSFKWDPPSDQVAMEGVPDANRFVSPMQVLDPGFIYIDIPNVKSAFLKPRAPGFSDVPLVNAGGDAWQVNGEIRGVARPVSNENVEIPLGYFEWFRDPGDPYRPNDPKYMWMFDLDNGRNYRGTSWFGEYDLPPESCRKATDVKPSSEYGAAIYGCNRIESTVNAGSLVREGYVWINSLKVNHPDYDNVNIDYDKVSNMRIINTMFVPGLSKTEESIEVVGTPLLDGKTLWYQFQYNATYDYPDEPVKGYGNGGLIAKYLNKWTMSVIGVIYEHSIYDVVYSTDDTPPPTKPNEASGGCTAPTIVQNKSDQYMDPQASGRLRADSRGGEKFDVSQGIPTSENLYANVKGLDYLFKYQFNKYSGTCSYDIQVTKTYNLSWSEEQVVGQSEDGSDITECVPYSDVDTKIKTYKVVRPFSYWKATNYEVYSLSKATVNNHALPPNGSVTLTPEGYTPPTATKIAPAKNFYEPAHDNVFLPSESVSGGCGGRPSTPEEDWTSVAEASVDYVEVQNDSVVFNGEVIMDTIRMRQDGPDPGTVPAPSPVGDNVLYRSGMKITETLENKSNAPTTGTINYSPVISVGGGGAKSYPINGMNSVTVHTPVVNYANVPDTNRNFDQSMNPDMSTPVLVLDRSFTLNLSEYGQHLWYTNYGVNDYRKYTKEKRARFPFDVYDGGNFIPAGTWTSLIIGEDSRTFTMPVWVDEGNYTIETEEYAINAPSIDSSLCERSFNQNLNNYCAYKEVPVHVVGRMFGFQINDIGDLRYETLFRTAKGSKTHTGFNYYSGDRDENGNTVSSLAGQRTKILPVRPGSVPNLPAQAPHNGYPFNFSFKTIGNVFGPQEGIIIQPSFWFTPKRGGSAVPVDLYYNASGANNKFIKVGSAQDLFNNQIVLADPLRNIPQTDLDNTIGYEYNRILSPSEQSATTWDKFHSSWLKTKVGKSRGYSTTALKYGNRTLIGPTSIPSGVDSWRALASVQQWYGEYRLPIAPYVLPSGTNLQTLAESYGGKITGTESQFLRGGYITVNFKITTYKNNDDATPVIGYDAPLQNMWRTEGQVTSSSDYLNNTYNFNSGDIIMFESDNSVRDDFQGVGH